MSRMVKIKYMTRPGEYGRASVRMDGLRRRFVGELIGTYLLVMIGTSSVAAAAITGAQVGLWQVAVVWTLGVSIAIYATAKHIGSTPQPGGDSSLRYLQARGVRLPIHSPILDGAANRQHFRGPDRAWHVRPGNLPLRVRERHRARSRGKPAFGHGVRGILPQPCDIRYGGSGSRVDFTPGCTVRRGVRDSHPRAVHIRPHRQAQRRPRG